LVDPEWLLEVEAVAVVPREEDVTTVPEQPPAR
jgi:hypothetical protein